VNLEDHIALVSGERLARLHRPPLAVGVGNDFAILRKDKVIVLVFSAEGRSHPFKALSA